MFRLPSVAKTLPLPCLATDPQPRRVHHTRLGSGDHGRVHGGDGGARGHGEGARRCLSLAVRAAARDWGSAVALRVLQMDDPYNPLNFASKKRQVGICAVLCVYVCLYV